MTEAISPPTSVSLPILPLKDLVVFPNSVMPLFISRHKDLMALEAGLAVNKTVFLAAQRSPADDHPGTKDIHRIGTAADVIQVLRLPDGSAKILVEGSWVGRIEAFEKDNEHNLKLLSLKIIPNCSNLTNLMRPFGLKLLL